MPLTVEQKKTLFARAVHSQLLVGDFSFLYDEDIEAETGCTRAELQEFLDELGDDATMIARYTRSLTVEIQNTITE